MHRRAHSENACCRRHWFVCPLSQSPLQSYVENSLLGEQFEEATVTGTPLKIKICRKCCENIVGRCEDCGKIVMKSDRNYRIKEHLYCLNCGEKHSVVKKYRTKPESLNFILSNKIVTKAPVNDVLYYGIELEVDNGLDREDMALFINDLFQNEVYLSRDGSLSSDKGFEITYHPMSYKAISERVEKIEYMFDVLKSQQWESSSDIKCGVHIHVSKSFFEDSNYSIGRIYKDLTSNIDSVAKMSNKDFNSFISYSSPVGGFLLAETDSQLSKVIEELKKTKNRNVMVNILNDATIEFRFFGGTLDVEILMGYVDFVKELCVKYR